MTVDPGTDPLPRTGHLVVIGGNEDRDRDMLVLRRFVELSGGADATIVAVLGDVADAAECWPTYRRAFGELGVGRREAVVLASRQHANDPGCARQLQSADGIFLAGGDARRLLALLGGTLAETALRDAFFHRGACIAGTSAGAAALSQHLMIEGPSPTSGSVAPHTLGIGLGLLQRAVVDQHFSERQRLGRLMAVVAQNPSVLGIGIDEDTALVLGPDGALEVVGDGAVTLIDGRQMSTNPLAGRPGHDVELIDVKLHLLPAGARYGADGRPARHGSRLGADDPRPPSPLLGDIVPLLAARAREALA